MTHVCFEKLAMQVANHNLISHMFSQICETGLGIKGSGISSDDSAKSPKLLSHYDVQAPKIL